LIAVISQVYDNVVADKELLLYTHRAELNKEYFMVMNFFNSLKDVKAIIFSVDKNLQEEKEDQFVGFV